MNTLTFIFLAIVTLLPYVSLMQVGRDRRRQCEYMIKDSSGNYAEVGTKFSNYYAVMASSLLCIAWFFLCPDPAGAIDSITPSYKTNNWIWTTIVACIIGIPMAAPLYLLFSLTQVSPWENWQTAAVVIALVGGILALLIPICQAYTFWLIHIFPVMGIAIPILLWPQTSDEKAESDKAVALNLKARAEAAAERDRRRSELWQDYKSGKRLVNTGGSGGGDTFPKRFRLTFNGKTVVVTQVSKYSEIDYEGDDGYRYHRVGGSWTRVSR